MPSLSTISFMDLFLGKQYSWLTGVPGSLDPIATPDDLAEELSELRVECQRLLESNAFEEFRIVHDEIVYRVSLLRSLKEDVFVLRRFAKTVPPLNTLNIHQYYVDLLLKPRLTGLLLVAGAFGQGKTTTASSIVVSRVSAFGGIAVCIENPPEMSLEGRHGEGVIYQREAQKGTFAHECRQAARFSPSIIFVGEVRDSETATEALRASINGRLVVCTIHSDGARTAVDRLYSYAVANGQSGAGEDVANMLAIGLLGVIHQRLEGEPKRPKNEVLWLGDHDSLGIRNMIRARKFPSLEDAIALQRNAWMAKSGRA